MHFRILLAGACACALGGGAPAAAQSPGAKASATTDAVTAVIRGGWDQAKGNIRESADQMPEADYAFKPTESVRTFGQILAHVAGANYEFCSAAKGEKSPFGEDHFEKTATTKAAIVKALQESASYCDGAYAALTDASAAESVSMPFGMGKSPRVRALLMNVGHLQEHYGNLVTYLRIKGIVPPSSRR